MALDKEYQGKDILLGFDFTTAVTVEGSAVNLATVKLVGCLTSNGFNMDTASQGTTTKCSGKFQTSTPGSITWGMSGAGVSIEKLVADTRITSVDLFKKAKTQEAFWAFTYDVAGDFVKYGVVRLDSYSESNDAEGASTFDMTLTGIGEVFDQDDLAPVI